MDIGAWYTVRKIWASVPVFTHYSLRLLKLVEESLCVLDKHETYIPKTPSRTPNLVHSVKSPKSETDLVTSHFVALLCISRS